MIVVRNWREQDPYMGHISAIIWPLYRQASDENQEAQAFAKLQGMNSFVKHGLQGRQHSDYHQHPNIEQMYYILRGQGELLIGQDKYRVQEGDAVYMPVTAPHQAFNNGDYWMEHLIVSCPLQEIREGTPAVRNWRDVIPAVGENKAIVWKLLMPEQDATPDRGGVLQRMSGVTRGAVQGRRSTGETQRDGIEQVYYILSGRGTAAAGEDAYAVTEGSAVYVPPGTPHQLINDSDAWLEYVVFAVSVEETASTPEAPEETSEDEGEDHQEV